MSTRSALRGLAAVLLLAASGAPLAAQGVGWRGDGSGIYAGATPPTRWSAGSNVLWRTALPGPSGAAPVPIAGRVFCCSDPDSLLCIDAGTGAIRWSRANPITDFATADQLSLMEIAQRDVADMGRRVQAIASEREALERKLKDHADPDPKLPLKERLDRLALEAADLSARLAPLSGFRTDIYGHIGPTYATPFCDGERIYLVLGTGVVACYDLDGHRLWGRYLETPTQHYGQTASPVVIGGKLLVHLNAFFALDPATGATCWRTWRRQTHGTAVPIEIGGEPMALTSYGDVLRMRDGHLMAIAGVDDYWWMWWPSPVVEDGVAYLIDGSRRAFSVAAAAEGAVATTPLWRFNQLPKPGAWFPSPVICGSTVCSVSSDGELFAFTRDSGRIACRRRIGEGHSDAELSGGFMVPLSLAGGRLFVTARSGCTWVLDPANEFAEVACNALEPGRSGPVFDGDRIYQRCDTTLYCIAEAK